MTKSQHEALIKFNQLSEQREICDAKAKRVKRYRNVAFIAFIASIILIAAYQLVVHSAFLQSVNLKTFFEGLPGNEYLFLSLGIISFVFLLVSVFKSINAEMNADKARKTEGKMAQKAFSLMLVKTKRNF